MALAKSERYEKSQGHHLVTHPSALYYIFIFFPCDLSKKFKQKATACPWP